MCEDLATRAKASDRLVYCRNRYDRQRIIEMLPSYTGVWRLHFPLVALAQATRATGDKNGTVEPPINLPSGASIPETQALAFEPEPLPIAVAPDLSSVARVLEIIDGDITSTSSGINLGFAFVSRPIRGAAKALRAKRNLEKLGIEAEMIADTEFAENRRRAFSWPHLKVPKGARRLLSAPISDPVAVTEAFASLPAGSVLRGMMSVISDGGDEGFRYRLVTGPLQGRAAAASVASALRRHSQLPFALVANAGVACDF